MIGHDVVQAASAARHAAQTALLMAAAKPDSGTTSLIPSMIVGVASAVITALATLVGGLLTQSRRRNNLKADLEIYKALFVGDARERLKGHIENSTRHLAKSGEKSRGAFFVGVALLGVGGGLVWVTSEVSIPLWRLLAGLTAAIALLVGAGLLLFAIGVRPDLPPPKLKPKK
jgi:hypothetical protein